MSSTSLPDPKSGRSWYLLFLVWGVAVLCLYPLLRVEDARVVLSSLGARALDVLVPLFLIAIHLPAARRIVRTCDVLYSRAGLLVPIGVALARSLSSSKSSGSGTSQLAMTSTSRSKLSAPSTAFQPPTST